jgi:uncharacterized protein involved in outer membrane biogenesis
VVELAVPGVPGRRRAWRVLLATVLALLVTVAIGEAVGWPFLAGPLQQLLGQGLDRPVQISPGPGFAVRFVGHPRLRATQLTVAAPGWSDAPHLLLAQDLEVELRWVDLWRARQGQPLRIHRLQAATLDVHLERQADGRASWTLGRQPAADAPPAPLPRVGSLLPGRALIHVRDHTQALELQARLTREADRDGADTTGAVQWLLRADGLLRQLPVQIEMDASSEPSAAPAEGSLAPLYLKLKAHVGRARLDYTGYAHDLLQGVVLDGRFKLQGPSLAAVGDLVGVTLPTTAAFQSRGSVVKQGSRWRVQVDDATIGASRLDGRFVYAGGLRVPLLTGRLGGSRLLLRDLGPVVGVAAAPAPEAAASAAPLKVALHKVLPGRPFDLGALRAMDAQVEIDIASVDLNTRLLEPLHPLRATLGLKGGVLSVGAIDARTAQGRLTGQLGLDGRGALALWTADLRWSGLRLEQWIRQERAAAAPPWVSGQLNGRVTVQGRGRSTAEILATLTGTARSDLQGGVVSQLAIEAAGLDLAESLGLLVTGDRVLPVTCAVADLVADGGVWRTRTLVLDTPDSTLWVDGTVALDSETMDLRVVVSPRDLSPLALRSPLRLRGSLANPVVSVDKGPLGRKVATSLLLALLNPLAALIPLIDTGSAAAAGRGGADCQRLMQARPTAR